MSTGQELSRWTARRGAGAVSLQREVGCTPTTAQAVQTNVLSVSAYRQTFLLRPRAECAASQGRPSTRPLFVPSREGLSNFEREESGRRPRVRYQIVPEELSLRDQDVRCVIAVADPPVLNDG